MRLWGWLTGKGGTDSTRAAPGGASPLVIDLVAEAIPTTVSESGDSETVESVPDDAAAAVVDADSGVVAERRHLDPPVTKLPIAATEIHAPEVHARRLLAWLQEPGEAGVEGPILQSALLRIYTEMCGDLNWQVVPWNTVAQCFSAILPGARKEYAWVHDDETGAKRRLRVYRIPPASPPPVDRKPAPVSKVVGIETAVGVRKPRPAYVRTSAPQARSRQRRVA